MSRHLIISVASVMFAIAAFGDASYQVSWIPPYGEAEPLHPIAAEFGQQLVALVARDGRQEIRWTDITSLLADERFAKLRDRGFVHAARPDILITIRVNDRFEFPIHANGTTGFNRRNDASSETN
jgi:hypothetical protein